MCKYCNTENTFTDTGLSMISKPYVQVYVSKRDNEYFLNVSEYEELKNIKNQYNNSSFRCDRIIINYCPMCGKKL